MIECVFCKIMSAELPSLKLFEDDLVVAFLAMGPISNGHLLVVPKEHFENIFTTPENILERINAVSKYMAILLKEELGATGVNILNASGEDAQQTVNHIHYHVVPRFKDDKLDLWFHGKSKDLEQLETVQKKLLNKIL